MFVPNKAIDPLPAVLRALPCLALEMKRKPFMLAFLVLFLLAQSQKSLKIFHAFLCVESEGEGGWALEMYSNAINLLSNLLQ